MNDDRLITLHLTPDEIDHLHAACLAWGAAAMDHRLGVDREMTARRTRRLIETARQRARKDAR
ncbi:hypothetical protein [Streptomonospora nanhaiensis]|uniref:hypothetical protein n=1 Tax=Streptomonospora nanhaiensis TaxID=1323731 RepID=UPI001C388309|nr:hypothetical protein [Streptomonospora nanhaiensis]MBV2364282.1 hypothetical protein [Streptomonospora nanhaiensis]